MKRKFLYILLIVLFNAISQPAQAGFFVKKQAVAPAVENVINSASQVSTIETSGTNKLNESANDLTPPPFRNMAYRGWIGMLAFILGILGFVNPIFSVGAVLFGFLGIGGRNGGGRYADGTDAYLRVPNRANRKKGLAIAGLVLGATVIVLAVFFGFTGWGLF